MAPILLYLGIILSRYKIKSDVEVRGMSNTLAVHKFLDQFCHLLMIYYYLPTVRHFFFENPIFQKHSCSKIGNVFLA